MAKKPLKITITKGKGHSDKSGKDYEFYELRIGHYSHRFFATSDLERYYLDKYISSVASEDFKAGSKDDSRLDPEADMEEELQKGLDGLF